MALHASVIRRLQGQIIGGDYGKDLIKLADDFMASEDIKNPLAISNSIAPGKWQM